MRYAALLDANVLVPYTLTDVLLRLAEAGFYRPLWSGQVLDEAERTLVHLHPNLDSAQLHRRFATMQLFFPDADVTGWADLVDSLELPDPDDRHVVAAAIVGGADTIVTANVRDFPDDRLAPFGITATHPDEFLLDQWDLDAGAAHQVLVDIASTRRRPSTTLGHLLAQLHRCGVPRFADHVATSC